MKLRIHGDSIRLRLGRSEVRQLSERGSVEATTHFGATTDAMLGYVIEAGDVPTITASFARGLVNVSVPRTLVNRWAKSDQIGLEALQPVGRGAELSILIEKDFACTNGANGESQEDAFDRSPDSLKCSSADEGVPM